MEGVKDETLIITISSCVRSGESSTKEMYTEFQN